MNNKDGLNIELSWEKILSIARGIDGICGLKKSKGESIIVYQQEIKTIKVKIERRHIFGKGCVDKM